MIDFPDWAGYLEFRDRFGEAIDERYFPMVWLDGRVLNGGAQFVRTDNAAMLFELRRFPGGALDVHCLVAAGDKDEIINDLAPRAEAWGKSHGVLAAVVESRPGWARALKSHGYEIAQICIRKEFRYGP